MLRLPRLAQNLRIVDEGGYPTPAFIQYWQQFAARIEQSVNAIQAALDAADVAQQAADDAAAAATAAQSAAGDAQTAAGSAQTSADAANDTLTDIQTGDFDVTAVKVGGQRFVNDGGTLVPE